MTTGKVLKTEFEEKHKKPSASYHQTGTTKEELTETPTEGCLPCEATASVGAQLARGDGPGAWL